MNERTHFIKISLSHFILERVDVGCACEVRWRWGQTAYWPQVLLIIAALLSHSGWAATVGHWGRKALCLPLALNSASCLQLTTTLTDSSHLWFLFNAHLLPLFFRLFTQVHLLIDGSVEGQYVTIKLPMKVDMPLNKPNWYNINNNQILIRIFPSLLK